MASRITHGITHGIGIRIGCGSEGSALRDPAAGPVLKARTATDNGRRAGARSPKPGGGGKAADSLMR
jgi:hypothetical protein